MLWYCLPYDFNFYILLFLVHKVKDLIKDCFVTGKWDKRSDAQALLEQDDNLYGDFEDLETGEVYLSKDAEKRDDIEEDGDEEEEEEEGDNS